MRPVRRDEISDYVTYTEGREAFRDKVLLEKARRRIHVGEYLTFLFENPLTVRYQVQEMMRIEHIVKEADIQHELDTYNELLGGPGALGCTLMIEIPTPEERDVKLRAWLNLPEHLYCQTESGHRVPAVFDRRQMGTDRASSVQYLTFDMNHEVPFVIGVDHPELTASTTLTPDQRGALEADLLSDQ